MKEHIKVFTFALFFVSVLLAAGCDGVPCYDIRGTWDITNFDTEGSFYTSMAFGFTGDMGEGALCLTTGWGTLTGSYEVHGKDVFFSYDTQVDCIPYMDEFTGRFTDKDNMSGTVESACGAETVDGTWTAVRLDSMPDSFGCPEGTE